MITDSINLENSSYRWDRNGELTLLMSNIELILMHTISNKKIIIGLSPYSFGKYGTQHEKLYKKYFHLAQRSDDIRKYFPRCRVKQYILTVELKQFSHT
jgi:hypothetical protein